MQIIVAVRPVVDHSLKVRPRRDGFAVDLSRVKMSMNPFDEIALEQAILFREEGRASRVVLLSIGGQACVDILRQGLAVGGMRLSMWLASLGLLNI